MKPLVIALAVLVTLLGALAFHLIRGEVGTSVANESDLMAMEKARGFLSVGRFPAPSWPAEIAEVQSAENSVAFTLADGTRQQYAGFDGYGLKVVTVQPASGPTGVYVFRTEKKAAPGQR